MDLPLALAGALETGNAVLFVGSGIGHYMVDSDGQTMPDGKELGRRLADKLGLDVGAETALAKVAQLAEIRIGRSRTVRAVAELFEGYEPNEEARWLFGLTWKAIYTTNYDGYIERCYEMDSDGLQNPVVMATNSDFQTWLPGHELPIVHLHGALADVANRDKILLTQQDYATYRSQRGMLFNLFKTQYADTPILYVGYSNEDSNWAQVTSELREEFLPGVPPTSFRLTPSTSELDRELLAHEGIETLDGVLADLRSAIWARFGDLKAKPANIDALRAGIPSQLHGVLERHPAPLARLLVSWEYVNQVDFGISPNTASFHQGNRANWGVVGSGINFERDLEPAILDDIRDFYTSSPTGVRIAAVLGSAGYGMSTLLLAVAAWYVRDNASTVLMLKSGAVVTDGDVQFAAKYLPGPVVFVVDDAADHSSEIIGARDALRSSAFPGYFLLGERLNEWRQSRTPLSTVEFQIEPLSDREIDRLIDSLERTSGLGKLGDLTPALRFSAIKKRNQQELLVTMREVTEGKSFDAIIEDEFRGITNDKAADIYALISAFTRVRALARDALIGEALGFDVTTLYKLLSEDLEGIAIWETVDFSRGIEGLRARHQIIADIVWDRCLDSVRRERLIIAAVSNLNLTYGIDAKAFEQFTRDDYAVDSLRTFEAKTRFFEVAARKDPGNAFVKQHYARMLRREKRYDLALAQIDSAVKAMPHQRSLQHTRGVVLRDMAVDASSQDVGRRWLAQSEAAFEGAIGMNQRDAYGYQSLAELYLDWGQRSTDARESVDYLAKAQETIVRGMSKAAVLEGLYLAESKIQKFLGDTPARIEALRSAMDQSPTSPIVRFLLGGALRSDGQIAQAIDVLHDGVEANPDDPRLAMAYALALRADGREYAQSIAPMSLTTLSGSRDPAFVATYGGMLAMDGQTEAAEGVWRSAKQRNFSIEDQRRVFFKPAKDGAPVSLAGEVSTATASFAFITVASFPDVFCPGNRIGARLLRKGDKVNFEVGFSASGPTVTNLV
ncbi:Tetratricopeptide repeat-containing protein [Agreia bicolorata]|uniref:Tetratricopeptide repeat-containing protein n=1 Tax=Agreia bicolorata TaxID=110935 RepID=A0A1T4XZF5_9MICO|nr:SIR2 family protein [Agreia bicolorata]SKA94405.1 Tetratricopeptide repeat-containing protein [Agreia bicolorata]